MPDRDKKDPREVMAAFLDWAIRRDVEFQRKFEEKTGIPWSVFISQCGDEPLFRVEWKH